jgi:hemoglobin-like flavoprotein
MTITPRQIDLVQESAAAVDHVLEPFAAAFYDRLFRDHPAVRPMFPTDTAVEATKLPAELRRIVGALLAPERFATQVRKLGARHQAYGAQPATTRRSAPSCWPPSSTSWATPSPPSCTTPGRRPTAPSPR